MCNAPFSAHGLKNEIYLCVVRLFRLMEIKERDIVFWAGVLSGATL